MTMKRNLTMTGGTLAAADAGDPNIGAFCFAQAGSTVYNFTSAPDAAPAVINAAVASLQGAITFNVTAGSGPVDLNVTSNIKDSPYGAGSLTKAGNGMMVLSGSNAYSGGTTISGGTLAVNGAINSTQNCTVFGGVLSGTGTIAGQVIVQGGAALAPGFTAGAGTLNVAALYLNGGPSGNAGALNLTLGSLASNSGFL
jgi:autotransporter-associated beta strand protein